MGSSGLEAGSRSCHYTQGSYPAHDKGSLTKGADATTSPSGPAPA
jgi:hypothetical protein